MDSSQSSTAFGTGRIPQQSIPYPFGILAERTQASASAVDLEAHRQPVQSRMLQRRGLQITSTEQGLDDTTEQRRHSHRRNIALHLAALNTLTYLSLSLKQYQLPHTTNWEYKTFEKLITVGERSLSDWFEELSDVAFDIKLSEYIDSLSVEDINLSINDVKAAQHYESLIDGFHRMYRASTTHCTLAQKAGNLTIPQRFDYCEGNYQEYVAVVLEEDQTNRKRLKIALNCADQLLSAIRTAMVDESLDDTNLARLKTKLTALQLDYPEAYQTVYGGPQRDLFDPGADRWWYE
ncbi:hypothetical protein F5144DRAFT_596382 [Chaetomium tenue]|uniref:Uncharacterized protein n=1 Tax=Chaetomium tenue TaxID=1854479 RepID=A0ACB7NX89_9PEZI|nr:hypothetical protein F5144DRAFT_596382 [Chaetomium globosum]